MKAEEFDNIAALRVERCLEVLRKKAAEYASVDDRLANFKRAATFEDETPEMALRGMLTKHVVSVYDMIDDLEFWNRVPTKALLDEKITDWINYAILLEALIEERREEHEDD